MHAEGMQRVWTFSAEAWAKDMLAVLRPATASTPIAASAVIPSPPLTSTAVQEEQRLSPEDTAGQQDEDENDSEASMPPLSSSSSSSTWRSRLASAFSRPDPSLAPSPSVVLPSALLRLERFILPQTTPALFIDLESLMTAVGGGSKEEEDDSNAHEGGDKNDSSSSSKQRIGGGFVGLDKQTRQVLERTSEALRTAVLAPRHTLTQARAAVLGGNEEDSTTEPTTNAATSTPAAVVSAAKTTTTAAWFSASGGFEIEGGRGFGEQVAYRPQDFSGPVLEDAMAQLDDLLAGIEGAEVLATGRREGGGEAAGKGGDRDGGISGGGGGGRGSGGIVVKFGGVAPYERGGVEAAVEEVLARLPTLRKVLDRGDGGSVGGSEQAMMDSDSIELRPRVKWNACLALEWILQRFNNNDNARALPPPLHGMAPEASTTNGQSFPVGDPSNNGGVSIVDGGNAERMRESKSKGGEAAVKTVGVAAGGGAEARCLPVYIGGARAEDEEVYAAVRKLGGIGVMVTHGGGGGTRDGDDALSSEGGTSVSASTSASYALSGTSELQQFLDLLVQAWVFSRSLPRYRSETATTTPPIG